VLVEERKVKQRAARLKARLGNSAGQ